LVLFHTVSRATRTLATARSLTAATTTSKSTAAAAAAAAAPPRVSRERAVAARRAAGVAGAGAAHLALVLAPYVLWATFAYRRFCLELSYIPTASGAATSATLPDASAAAAAAAAEWCHRPLPDLYSHVQTKYWGVGALRYYQWRQLPNFALAAPAFILCASACLTALAALRPTKPPPAPTATDSSSSSEGGDDNQRLLTARRAAATVLPPTSPHPIDARWATKLLPSALTLASNPNPNPGPNPRPKPKPKPYP